MRYLLVVLCLLFVVAHTATAQEEAAITCESVLISPEENRTFINANSLHTGEDGQIVYLIPNPDTESYESQLIHVTADDTVRNIGTFTIAEGVYRFPHWVVDTERGFIVYLSIEETDSGVNLSIEHLNLDGGERSTLMEGVSEFGPEPLDDLVWWGTKTGTAVYDPETGNTAEVPFPTGLNEITASSAVRLISEQEVLFSAHKFVNDRVRPHYYRGNLETGETMLLHEDELADGPFSNSESSVVLEDSIVYINAEGVLKEIDFEGNVLRTVDLLGEGYYRLLHPMKEGWLFTFYSFDESINALYYVTDTVQRVMPEGLNFPYPSTQIETLPEQEQVWMIFADINNHENGTLYGFSLAGETPKLIMEREGIMDFEISPQGNYLIINEARQGTVLSAETFDPIVEIGDFYGNREFSEDDQQLFFSIDNEIYIYNFETGERETLVASENHYPEIFFVDYENQLAYFHESLEEEMNGYLSRIISVTNFEGAPPVLVQNPDVDLAFDTHARGYSETAANDIVYFAEEWQQMFRARCN